MRLIASLVDDLLEGWHPSRWLGWATLSMPVVLSLLTIAAALVSRPLFDVITGEDRLGENLQVVAWIIALVFAVLVAADRRHTRVTRVLFGLLAIGLVFNIGEEISWGQRILDFETPEELLEQNRQGESNLHNIYGVQDVFSWLMLVIGAYGFGAAAYGLRRFGTYTSWPDLAKTLVPHPVLMPSFLLLFVWRFYRNLFEPPENYYVGVSEFGEITELVLAIAFALFTWRRWTERRGPSKEAAERPAAN